MSEDAARMRVDRALEKLRASLDRRGIASTVAALGVALANHAVVAAPASLAAQVAGTATVVAAASGVGATAAGVFEFMSTTKAIVGVAGVVAMIAALGLATNKVRASRVAEALLATATERHAATVAKLRDAEERGRAAEAQAAELKQSVEATRRAQVATVQTATKTAATTSLATSDPMAAGDAFMTRHPEIKRAVNDYARARIDFRFAELYRTLGLTAGQIERFRVLMSAGFGMGASGATGESMSLVSGDRSQIESRYAQLEPVLGVEGMKVFRDYALWIEPAREIAARAAGALWFTETPLTLPQADRLVQIMNESRALPAPGPRQTGPLGKFDRFDWDAIFAKAGSVLSAPQLAALEGQRAHERLNAALNRPVQVASVPKSGAAPAPAR